RQVSRRSVEQYRHMGLERWRTEHVAHAGSVDNDSNSEATTQRLHSGVKGSLRPTEQSQAVIVRNIQRALRAALSRPGLPHQLVLNCGIVAAQCLFNRALGMNERMTAGES